MALSSSQNSQRDDMCLFGGKEENRLSGRCDEGIWDAYDAKEPVPLARFTKSSRRGCAACRMVLAIVKNVRPGWADSERTEKKIRLRKGEIALLEGDKAAGRFKLYERVGMYS